MESIPGRDIVIEDIAEAVKQAEESKAKMISPLKDFDRITAQFVMHKETCADKPITASARFCSLLKSQGIQPYQRKMKISDKWIPLDLGWIPSEGVVGFLFLDYFITPQISSLLQQLRGQGKKKKVQPPPSLLVSISGNEEEIDFELDVGHCNVYTPRYPEKWRIRSTSGIVQVAVTVFPR